MDVVSRNHYRLVGLQSVKAGRCREPIDWGMVVHHRELLKLESDLFKTDREHLNAMSLDLWTLDIRKNIDLAMRVWRDK